MVIRAGAPGDERAIFLLPRAYRPNRSHAFPGPCIAPPPTTSTPNNCGVEVRPTGLVVSVGSYDAVARVGTSLGGISYMTR